MTKFLIAEDQTWRIEYSVEAKDEAEAIKKVEDGEAEAVSDNEPFGDTKHTVLSAQPTVIQTTLGGE